MKKLLAALLAASVLFGMPNGARAAGNVVIMAKDGITPLSAMPIESYSSGNVAASTATATLTAPTNGRTAYLTGFEVTGTGATAASVVALTVTGLLGGTATYNIVVPAGVTIGLGPLNFEFGVGAALAASAPNTAIVVSMPTLGSGNAHAAIVAHGYQQ